jgi:hypothetical protein
VHKPSEPLTTAFLLFKIKFTKAMVSSKIASLFSKICSEEINFKESLSVARGRSYKQFRL